MNRKLIKPPSWADFKFVAKFLETWIIAAAAGVAVAIIAAII